MIFDWLMSPVDPTRAHDVGMAVAWHGRAMVLGWGIMAPLAILIARFFKILPHQEWPRVLDSRVWWRGHWMTQSAVYVLSILAVVLVLPAKFTDMPWHAIMGWAVIGCASLQIVMGATRGSKGGPTAPRPDGSLHGSHYDMTTWRLMFERVHKSLGYATLILAFATILAGIWKANGPIWMVLVMVWWWSALLGLFIVFQSRGMAIDTYQAIWGADPSHPGNQRAKLGWGVRRPGDPPKKRKHHVRNDRGGGLQGH